MKPASTLFIFVLIILSAISGLAQWSTDPGLNLAVCTEIYNQREAAICSDGQGGAFIVWRDYRNISGIFEGDIYAQHLDFNGIPLWAEDGIVVNNAPNGQFRPKVISDDSGGFIVVWAKNGGGFYGYDLYAQRIDSGGNLLWSPNGVTITLSSATDTFHEIIPDGNGGMIVTWMRLPTVPGQTDIYAQKIDADGNVLWTNNGVAVCTAVLSQNWPQLVSDSEGGAIIAWEDGRNGAGTNDIYAQRLDANGAVQWTVDGLPVCSDASIQTETAICSDGSGGAIIAWQDHRNSQSAVYGQRINSMGEAQWITDGKYLSSLSSTCTKPILNYDPEGSAYIVWITELPIMETNIGSQKIDLDGNPYWGADGLNICNAPGNQTDVSVMNNIAGGIVITWQDSRSGDLNIYAQWIDRDGTVKWTGNGVEISTASGNQTFPVLTTDGLAGSIISWWDLRNGTDEDIFVQNVDYRGKPGTTNYYYQRQNLNKPINEGSPSSDTLIVPVFKDQKIYAVYDITLILGEVLHDYVNDLELNLTHNGISDTLIYRIEGNGGQNFKNTYLNDNLGITFEGAAAPFTGVYLPHNELTVFSGASIPGEWILTITDHKQGDDGILMSWGLLVSESPIVGVKGEKNSVPGGFTLNQNYPNPFNPSTVITYDLSVASFVSLKVFDVLGREVKNLADEYKPAGRYEVKVEADGWTSGVYFYQMKADEFIQTKKMVLVK